MLVKHLVVALAQTLKQPRRALDIAEQQRRRCRTEAPSPMAIIPRRCKRRNGSRGGPTTQPPADSPFRVEGAVWSGAPTRRPLRPRRDSLADCPFCLKGAAALRQMAPAAAVRRVVHGGSERGADGADVECCNVECCIVKSSGPTCAAARRAELASRAPARSRLLVSPSKWCPGRGEQFAVRLCASRLVQPRWSARTSRGARRAAAKTPDGAMEVGASWT